MWPGCVLWFIMEPGFISAQPSQHYFEQLIEIITENIEGAEEFDYSELGQLWDDWQRNPVDINSEDATLFLEWNIISELAFHQLHEHILRHGPLLSILELQSVPGFNPETIRILQLISEVKGREAFTQNASLSEIFLHGQNEIYVRIGRTIEKAKGYQGDIPVYEGNSDKLYLRLRHRHSSTLSYGFTGEKDAGESFFKGSNQSGFDFNSLHLALQNYRSWLPALMLGDFSASFGQGLIMHSGFGAGKSSFVTSIKRTGNPLRQYTSVDENNFMRGAAISIRPMEKLLVTFFVSRNNRDGNLVSDTIKNGAEIIDINTDISSLQTANLHRTQSEIADENSIEVTQAGASISYLYRRSYIGLNALHSRLSIPLNRKPELYNQFYFNGDRLTNASIDYGLWIGGLHFFGETAMSDNGGIATVNGLLAGLDRHILLSILFRSYKRNYQSLTPNAFGEGSTASNETGLYTGIEITPSGKWKFQFYHDIWTNPWLRFNVDSPSDGSEYFARVTYTIKRRLEIYLQFRSKLSSLNSRSGDDLIPDIVPQRRSNMRIHINNMLDKAIQLRTRLEWSFYALNKFKQNGLMIYQDVIYKPIASPWSASARVTLFDTDDFQSRIYTYENDLIYYYAIPAFDGRGSRYYINLRYKGIRNLTAEIKYASTRWLDELTVGSGNDEIQGNRRSEIRAQLIYRFEN